MQESVENHDVDLKLCPFCGGDAHMIGDQSPYVECSKCYVSFASNHEYDFDHQSAADKWNKRYTPPTYCSHCSKNELATRNTEVGFLCDNCYQNACDGGL